MACPTCGDSEGNALSCKKCFKSEMKLCGFIIGAALAVAVTALAIITGGDMPTGGNGFMDG